MSARTTRSQKPAAAAVSATPKRKPAAKKAAAKKPTTAKPNFSATPSVPGMFYPFSVAKESVDAAAAASTSPGMSAKEAQELKRLLKIKKDQELKAAKDLTEGVK